MFEKAPVRRTGENLWRPSVGERAASALVGLAFLAGTTWLISAGDALSFKDMVLYTAGDLFVVVMVPLTLLRWRLVLEHDELIFVFVRVRRVPVREIVNATCVAKRGLVFVLEDGSEESFAGLGNSAWGHRRKTATRTDLAARAVLCAAARARGEAPPTDFRLGPVRGVKRAALEGGIAAFVIGLFLGD